MDKNEQCRRLSILRDKLQREYNEAKKRCQECAEELELIDAVLKQLSATSTLGCESGGEYQKGNMFVRSGLYEKNTGSAHNTDACVESTSDYASKSDVYFGPSPEYAATSVVKDETVQKPKDIELDFLTTDSDETEKTVRHEEAASVDIMNHATKVEQVPVRPAPKLVFESADPYADIIEDDRKDYESFMKAYMEGALPEAKCRVLGISQNLSNFTKEKWEAFEGKNDISLVNSPSGKYWAYPMDEGERRFFLVPSKYVKFNHIQCITNGFPTFFDFDIDKATGSEFLTPVVVLPAIVEQDAEGRYFRAGQGEDYPPKGKLKL